MFRIFFKSCIKTYSCGVDHASLPTNKRAARSKNALTDFIYDALRASPDCNVTRVPLCPGCPVPKFRESTSEYTHLHLLVA